MGLVTLARMQFNIKCERHVKAAEHFRVAVGGTRLLFYCSRLATSHILHLLQQQKLV